jgi:2-polyprenyl-6-methoxyphenol hydroxylase-like FAD-dependent oxidoreductase
VVLIGGAARGMLPYMAQGAAASIEDGAALAECLDRAESVLDLQRLLSAFEMIRKSRCETIAKSTVHSQMPMFGICLMDPLSRDEIGKWELLVRRR